ncbi:hypothetical protein [Tepidimonas charontis]|uniref:hypothetical protein n=1 Tax=Tepidimonas charontis TaxID=2267262 RepID=UPI0011846BE2|nr:hypothetical protein [Tepidimonas charontis]
MTKDIAAATPPSSGVDTKRASGDDVMSASAQGSESEPAATSQDPTGLSGPAIEPTTEPQGPVVKALVTEGEMPASPQSPPSEPPTDSAFSGADSDPVQLALLVGASALAGVAIYLRRRQRKNAVAQGKEEGTPLLSDSNWLTRWRNWRLRSRDRLNHFPFRPRPSGDVLEDRNAVDEQTSSARLVANEKPFATGGQKDVVAPLIALWDRLDFFESWGQPEEALRDIEAYFEGTQPVSEALYLRAIELAKRLGDQSALDRFAQRYHSAFGTAPELTSGQLSPAQGLLANQAMLEELQAQWPHRAREWLEHFILSTPEQRQRFPLRTLGAFDDAIVLYRLLDELESLPANFI